MPRNNKITERVFVDIARPGSRGSYEKFLAVEQELGLPESESLAALKERYAELIKSNIEDLRSLSIMEEIIIQMRAKEVINSELRLSLSRDYIYARSLFYRGGKEMNDIRVVVGKISEYGDNLDKLLKDQDFRALCRKKLIEAMDREISRNVANLNFVFKYD